ncbi:MAG TPA: hypothetical protein VFZ85_07335 [Jiangellaceae bacterium]
MDPSQVPQRVRTAELAAALCLATDLGMGLPLEYGLKSTLVAMRLADRLGLDAATRRQAYGHELTPASEQPTWVTDTRSGGPGSFIAS